MRASTLATSAFGCQLALAAWFRWPTQDYDLAQGRLPRQTDATTVDALSGWSPAPTAPPGPPDASRAVLELLHKRSSNTYENNVTCGYSAGQSSAPWTCSQNSTCATNDQNVVACVSGTYSPFFTQCFDYQAYLGGACASAGAATGCCESSTAGACGTFLWTGNPPRSMYRCFAQATVISMLDEPQFVVDGLTSSSTTSSSTSSTTSTSSTSTATDNGSGNSGSGGNNTGAIVGGAVGGVAIIAIIVGVVAFLLIRRRRQRPADSTGNGNNTTYNAGYNAVPPADPNYPRVHQQAPYQPSPSPNMSSVNPTTFPPTSPYPASAAAHTVSSYDPHDPRQSYYDPTKTGHVSPGTTGYQQSQQYGAAYAQYPGQQQPPQQPHHGAAPLASAAGTLYPPGASPPHSPDPHQHHSAELDASPGHLHNPVEMPAERQ